MCGDSLITRRAIACEQSLMRRRQREVPPAFGLLRSDRLELLKCRALTQGIHAARPKDRVAAVLLMQTLAEPAMVLVEEFRGQSGPLFQFLFVRRRLGQ